MYISKYVIILVAIQTSSTLANAPLKCFLQHYPFLNLFTNFSVPISTYDAYKISSLQLDPVRVDYFVLDRDGLRLDTKDLEYTGLNDAIVDEFGLNLKSNVSRLIFHFDLLGKGQYKIAGTLFSMPINGEGTIFLKLENVKVDMTMPFNITLDGNGNRVIDLKGFYYWHDISDEAEFIFSNLYDGDKEKSDIMHYLINQNWRSFTHQFGKPYMDKIFGHAFNVIKNQLLLMPLRNLDSC
ncbi:uncharacterized protein LOC124543870 [Vanessa cardui]|uniref:uncharacterized protein LOC124543870 n=1 Tax=Vanessa cardui TaxID=171605 RepID=UPI001F12CD0C|nr:uncharacterized protein LOC124543870 [Vanessa cardui]